MWSGWSAVLGLLVPDYCPLALESKGDSWGFQPFKFELAWLHVNGCISSNSVVNCGVDLVWEIGWKCCFWDIGWYVLGAEGFLTTVQIFLET